ncbi:HTH_48 domain-containing protein [Trichonephila clavipes]|nr:HTH_48 domain-containing protein [Trichonephila clavipes]
MITIFFIPELNNHDVQELWFQQDGATCHTARATIDLLEDTFGYVKSLVYADKPQTLDHLEDNIRRVIADIPPQMLEKVIENGTSRLDYIRASGGSPMPEIIFKILAHTAETYSMLVRVYDDQALSMKYVYEWFACFREGRESVSENPRSESPSTAASYENIEKVSKLIPKDRRLTVYMIVGREFLQANVVKQFLAKTDVVHIEHPLFLPDLNPPDFFLFQSLKLALKGKRFDDISDIQRNVTSLFTQIYKFLSEKGVAAVAEWYRHRIVAGFVTSSSPVPLKTRRVGQRCTLNLSRAETSSRWCGVVVRRGGASLGVVHVT